MTWVVLLAVVSLAAVALTLFGLRGRRADAHPLCRRCGFDLTGNPDAQICTECGADLTRPRAIKVGHRSRRVGPLVAGLALLVPCVLLSVIVVYVVVRGVDVQTYKPAWLLVRNLRSSDVKVIDAAVAELGRRGKSGSLGDANTLAGVDALLDVQRDAARPWNPRWGDWIESQQAAGVVGSERTARYYRQVVVPTLRVRPHVRRGDPMPAAIEFVRRGGSRLYPVYADWRGAEFRVGGVDVVRAAASDQTPLPDGSKPFDAFLGGADYVPPPRNNREAAGRFAGPHLVLVSNGPEWLPRTPGEATATLPAGPHQVRLRLSMSLQPAVRGGAFLSDAEAQSWAWDADRVDYDLAATVVIEDADAPQWRVKDDAAARAAMAAAVSVSTVHRQSWGDGRYQVQVYVSKLPLLSNWDVQLRPAAGDAGEAVAADLHGGLGFVAGASLLGNCSFARLPSPGAMRVDVVLLPRADALLTRVDPPETYGGPLVILNVPVAPSGPRFGAKGPR